DCKYKGFSIFQNLFLQFLMMKIVLIDNYDSFTHNLARYFREQPGVHLEIIPNDKFKRGTLDGFDKLVISPGPGLPRHSGFLPEILQEYADKRPVLGICLGHQALYEHFGGSLLNLSEVKHGVTSRVWLTDNHDPLFNDIDTGFEAGRYHSWVCDHATLPDDLLISATDDEGWIMALRHRILPLYGVQFHPESFLTPIGEKLIQNFVLM